ncbi:MAG: threonylcarbamoyl-AMP synthase [Candidatus Margulisbacteria bacterium]|nr:threonylcarbamoyl-AMP synthase [Candidatus Margulisiibacteriota bacterium]
MTPSECARHLLKEEVGIIPCDTLWGLVAISTPTTARRLNHIKERSEEKPFLCLMSNLKEALNYAVINPLHEPLIRSSWPGPITFIFSKKETVPNWMTGGKNTIAIRIPQDVFLQHVLAEVGRPIFSTSANISGQPFPKSLEEVHVEFRQQVDFVFPSTQQLNRPSTIIDLTRSEPQKIR